MKILSLSFPNITAYNNNLFSFMSHTISTSTQYLHSRKKEKSRMVRFFICSYWLAVNKLDEKNQWDSKNRALWPLGADLKLCKEWDKWCFRLESIETKASQSLSGGLLRQCFLLFLHGLQLSFRILCDENRCSYSSKKAPRMLRTICVTERPCSSAEDASANKVFTRFPLQYINQRSH